MLNYLLLCFTLVCFHVNGQKAPVLLRQNNFSFVNSVYDDNVIVIGHAQVLTGGPELIPPIIIANYLWQDKVNARGGILLRGKNYTVSVITLDLGFPIGALTNAQFESAVSANITRVWNEFVKPNATGLYGRVDITVSPYSSTYSPISCLVSERERKVQVSGGSSASGVYTCINGTNGRVQADCSNATFYGDTRKVRGVGERRFFYSVGTRGLANNYYPDFITLMKIKQAQTIGVFYEDVDFGRSCAIGLNATARTLKMNVTYFKAIPSLQFAPIELAAQSVNPVVDELIQIKPDVVLTCGYLPICSAFVEYAYLLRYTPKAFGCTIAVNQQFLDKYGFEAEYFSGPIGWDSRLKGPGYDESNLDSKVVLWDATGTSNTSSELYANDLANSIDQPYKRTGNMSDFIEANDQSVSQVITFYIIHQAILSTDSLEPEAIISAMNIMFIRDTIWGPVQFNNNGANIGKIYLNLQMINLATVLRSSGVNAKRSIDQTQGNITLEIVTPLSAATVEAVYPLPTWQERFFSNAYLKTPAEIGVITVNSFFLAITIILMFVLIFIRNTPQIKSSSFVFCELILLGAAMVYASLYFWTIFTFTALCNVQVWLFIFGIDICVGSLLAKNIRLFYIFKNAMKLRKVKPIANWQLFLMVIALMLVDAIVIIVWEAAFPIKAFRITQQVSKPAFDYVLCGSIVGSNDIYQTAFIATLGSLKAILLIIGVLLSIAVRKQPSEFNESRTIAFAIYNQSFCLICLLAIWLAITDDNYTLKYILRSFIVLWGNTITILVIFGRKLYYIGIGKNKAFKGRGSSSISKGGGGGGSSSVRDSKTTGTDNS